MQKQGQWTFDVFKFQLIEDYFQNQIPTLFASFEALNSSKSVMSLSTRK